MPPAPHSRSLRFPLILAAMAVLVLAVTGGPAARRVRFNRAYYHANLGEWSRSLELLGPLARRDPAHAGVALLEAEARLNLGDPFRARARLDALDPVPAGRAGEAKRLLTAEASLLMDDPEGARKALAKGADPFGKALLEFLDVPARAGEDPPGSGALAKIARDRFPLRPLHAGLAEWLTAQKRAEAGEPDEAARRLSELIERFPGQIAFRRELGLARLRSGAAGTGSAQLLASAEAVRGRFEEAEGAAMLNRWSAELEAEIREMILAGRASGAMRVLRALGPAMAIRPEPSLKLAALQPNPSPETLLEIASTAKPYAGGKEDRGGEGLIPARAEPWLRALANSEPGRAVEFLFQAGKSFRGTSLLNASPVSLWGAGEAWRGSIPPPSADAARRLLALRVRSARSGGVGAAFEVRRPGRADSALAGPGADWFGFDLPMTAGGESLDLEIVYLNDRMPGVDSAGEDRNLFLHDVLVIEFQKAGN